jgi:DNA-binding NarL/FixJ family response regulator
MSVPDASEMLSARETGRPRVLVADDHPSVLESLVDLLKDRFDLVASVRDGRRLVESARDLRPDIVVTDISMPGLNGIEAVRALRAAGSDAKVIFLTLHDDPGLAAKLMQNGASGFVLKMTAADDLATAIETVARGEMFVTASLDLGSTPSTRPDP